MTEPIPAQWWVNLASEVRERDDIKAVFCFEARDHWTVRVADRLERGAIWLRLAAMRLRRRQERKHPIYGGE